MANWIFANFGWNLLVGISGLLILSAVVSYSLRDNNKNDKPYKFPSDNDHGM
ncbi:hypothetical protein [Cytobacillus purgationiresistens]|uniref:Tumor necrosis factor receptor superfamily member 19 n=1 Tax=Cytobacillus purgationiresistens TaxID=863449 RepID=A0ABU0AQ59_9BACI|nr:hypothetical protein [Cytobacillus purgationiresistens]MDQ0273421.1 hypothetical protein [Cytobacillus purgationiresistens]